MKKLLLATLCVASIFSCNKTENSTPSIESPQATVDKAVKSTNMADFYALTYEKGELIRNNLKLASKLGHTMTGSDLENKLQDLTLKQASLMMKIKQEINTSNLNQDKVLSVFKVFSEKRGDVIPISPQIKAKIAKRPYGYYTNCKADWDDENNLCWNTWMWAQFYGLLKGEANWGSQVDAFAAFRGCSQAAEDRYYFCSGD